MLAFEKMGDAYVGVLTPKAIEFGGGDPDRVAAAGFARFLSERSIVFDWHDDLTFDIDTRWRNVEAQASRTAEADYQEVIPLTDWTVAVRVAPPLVAIHTVTYRSHWERELEQHGSKVPLNVGSLPHDFLMHFPHLWPDHPDPDQQAYKRRFTEELCPTPNRS